MLRNSAMISIQQIRGARAMLGWSQKQLADVAGISLRNIHNIEAGLVVPRLQTVKAIQHALEKAKIVFSDGCGVALKEEIFNVDWLEGTGSLEALVNDMIEGIRGGVREILLCNTNERNWIKHSTQDMKRRYDETMERTGARERCLIAYGDTILFGKPEYYRWLPEEYFGEVSYVVCGPLLVIIVWEPILRIVRIRNEAITKSYRRHFEGLWKLSTVPPFLTAGQGVDWEDGRAMIGKVAGRR